MGKKNPHNLHMAASLSIHQISDSDSDATVPPSDIENGLDGSQDLFDTNSSEAFAISSNSFIQKTRMNKSVCNPHEISGSDTDEDVKPKIMEKPVKASNFQSSKKQPAFSGKRHSVSSLSQGHSSPLASSSVTCSSTVGACVSGHESQANNMKPRCKYGDKCFRKNPSHLKEFYHGGNRSYVNIVEEHSPTCYIHCIPHKHSTVFLHFLFSLSFSYYQ